MGGQGSGRKKTIEKAVGMQPTQQIKTVSKQATQAGSKRHKRLPAMVVCTCALLLLGLGILFYITSQPKVYAIKFVVDGQEISVSIKEGRKVKESEIPQSDSDDYYLVWYNSATHQEFDPLNRTVEENARLYAVKTVARPVDINSFVYDGTPKQPVFQTNTCYTISGDQPETNAGTYNATATLIPGEGYEWEGRTTAPQEIEWTIKKAERTGTALTLNKTIWEYASGTDVIPNVSPIQGIDSADINPELIEYRYYKTTLGGGSEQITKPVNAGTYYIYAVIKESLNFKEFTTNAVQFEITRAAGNGSVTMADWTYNGLASSPSPASATNGTSKVTYFYKSTDGGGHSSTEKPVNAGTYEVEATFAETTNYKAFTKTATFRILKANGIGTVTIQSWEFGDTSVNPVATSSTNTGAVTYLYESTDSAGYSSADKPTAVGAYRVKAIFTETSNYNEVETAYVNFSISQAAGEGSVTINNWTYGASPVLPTIVNPNGLETTISYIGVGASHAWGETSTAPDIAGTFQVKVVFAGNESYLGFTRYAQFQILKANHSNNTITMANWVYGQAASEPSIGGLADGTPVYHYSDGVSTISGRPSNAGTYYISVVVEATANYNRLELGPISFTIEKAKLAVPTMTNGTFTYNGFQREAGFSISGIETNANYVITGNKQTNAGTYTATVAIADPSNYQWVSSVAGAEILPLDFSWVINRAQIDMPTVTSTDFTYNGTPKTPSIATNSNYTITGNEETNAGTYYATVTLDSQNYEWKSADEGQETAQLKLEWKILKAQITEPFVTKTNITYDGTVRDPGIAESIYNYYTVENNYQTNAGTYIAKVTFVNANCEWAGATAGQETAPLFLEWTINRAQLVIPAVTIGAGNTALTYSGTAQSPTISDINSNIQLQGATQTNAGNHTAVASIIDKTNFEWIGGTQADISLNWEILKINRTNTLSINGWTYNEYNALQNTPSVGTVGDNVVPVYTFWEDSACLTTQIIGGLGALNAGTYYVKAEIAGSTNYNFLTLIKAFTVAPEGDVIIPGSPAALIYSGEGQSPDIGTSANPNCKYIVEYYSDASCTVKILDATNVGTYYAKLILKDTLNTNWDDKSKTDKVVTWQIIKAQLLKPTAGGDTVLTYNAAGHVLLISGFDSETMNIQDNAKTVTGTYTAIITLKDTSNYEWIGGGSAVTISWEIIRANRINEVSIDEWWFVDGTHGIPSVGDVAESANVTYLYSTSLNGSYTAIPQPTGVGTYYVRAVIAQSTNFNALTTEPVQFRIVSPPYTISFNSMGGSQTSPITELYQTNISQPTNPALAGYTFSGWYTESTLDNLVGWPYTITGDVTFYAKWTINALNVAYNYDNGTGSPSSVTVNYGSSVTLPTPTRTGYVFLGWTGGLLDEEIGVWLSQNVVSNLETGSRNVTLVAQWEVKTLTIIYVANNGSGSMTNSGPTAYNSTITVKNSAFIAPNEYLTFWRWNTKADGTGTPIALSLTMSELWALAEQDIYFNRTLTLYAEWDTIFEMSGSSLDGQITGIKSTAIVPADLVIPQTVFSKREGRVTYDVKRIALGAFQGYNLSSITLLFIGDGGSVNTWFGYIFGANNYSIQNTYVPSSLKTVTILYGDIPNNAFYGLKNIERVNMHEGTESIGKYAFYGCLAIESINLPNLVESIGDYAFSGSGLGSVNLFGTNVTEISEGVFKDCINLVSVTLHSDTVIIGNSAFYGCALLASIALPSDLDEIQSYAFAGCTVLTTIKIPNSVTKFGINLFENSGILTVEMPLRNNADYQSIFHGFANGRTLGLTLTSAGHINLPNGAFAAFNGTNGKPNLININITSSGITSIGTNAFERCTGLTSITFPASLTVLGNNCFKGSGLTSINLNSVTVIPESAFMNCTSLATVIFNASTSSIGRSAFEGCTSLNTGTSGIIELPNTVIAVGERAFALCTGLAEINFGIGLTSIAGDTLAGCNNLIKITMPLLDMNTLSITYSQLFNGIGGISKNFEVVLTTGTSTALINSAFEDFTGTGNKPKLTSIMLPSNLTIIGARAFAGCTALSSIQIPDSVQIINASAFEGCSAIHNIDLSSTWVSEIKASTFKNCSSLFSITLRDDITAIGASAFEGCTALEKFILQNNPTTVLPSSVHSIGTRAFYGCAALESIDLSTTGVQVISVSAFENCAMLSEVHLPNGLAEISDYAFKNCSALKEIIVPNNVGVIFGDGIFSGSGLLTITLPLTIKTYQGMFDGLTTNLNAVFTYNEFNTAVLAEGAFAGFNGTNSLPTLKRVTLPNGVTSISASAFANCSGLTSVLMPNSVTSIGNSAFAGCSQISNITLSTGLIMLGNQVFYGCTGMTSIIIPNSVTAMGDRLFENSGIHTVTMPLRNVSYQSIFTGLSQQTQLALTLTATDILAIPVGAFKNFNGTNNLPRLISIVLPANITSISEDGFANCTYLTTVNFNSNTVLVTIGISAFNNCASLQTITIPASVSTISASAFESCVKLSSIDLSGLTSLTVISDKTFKGCVLLGTVKLPGSITRINDSAFYGCSTLNGISIPSNVNFIGEYAFFGCRSLTSVDLSGASSGGLSIISISAFEDCTALNNVILPTNTSAIENRAFAGTTALTTINIPNSATIFGVEVFIGGGLTSITLPFTDADYSAFFRGLRTNLAISFNYTSVVMLSANAFKNFDGTALNNVPNLTAINLPTNLTSIGASAFQGCTGLTTINIPSTITAINSRAFSGCTGITTVTIPSGATTFGGNLFENSGVHTVIMPLRSSADYSSIFMGFANGNTLTLILTQTTDTVLPASAFINFDGTTNTKPRLISITLPNNLEIISSRAFEGCIGLTSIVIPGSVNEIGVSAFEGCVGLTSIDLSGTSISKINNRTFRGCILLATVILDDSVESIGDDAFYGCVKLSKIDIPSNVNNIGKFAFYNCKSLTAIDLSTASAAGLAKVMESAFEGCILLQSVTLPSNLNEIEDKAFAGCTSLTTLIVPDNEVLFGANIFDGAGLTRITMPFTDAEYSAVFYGLRTSLEIIFTDESATELSDGAFVNFDGTVAHNLPNLSKVTLPENLISIGISAFSGCSGLGAVGGIILPTTVTNIGASAFNGCSSLNSINIPTGVTSIGAGVFANSGINTVSMPARNGFDYQSIFSGANTPTKTLTLTLKETIETVLPNGAFANFNGQGNTPRLISITLPLNLTVIGSTAFQNCSGLITIDLRVVNSIGASAFYGCTGLTSINLSGTQITTIASSTFYGCTGLTSVVFRTGILSIQSSAFQGCTGLGTIVLPDTVTDVGSNAFSNCTSLHTINFGTGLISLADNAISGSNAVTSIILPLQNISYTNLFNGVGGAENQLSVIFTNNLAETPVTVLPANAFSGFNGTLNKPKLISVTLPNNLVQIGVNAFLNCKFLSSILIPNAVSIIGASAFEGCSILGTMDLSRTLVTDIADSTFKDCTLLATVALPNGISTIGDSAFEKCSTLNGISIPNNINSIGTRAFFGCSSLTSIDLSGVSQFGLSIISVSAFEKCTSLSLVKLPDNTSEIQDRAFADCAALVELVVPDTADTFGQDIFCGSSLTKITLPFTNANYAAMFNELSTNLEIIFTFVGEDSLSASAFAGFNGTLSKPTLEKITLPQGLENIGASAFAGCRNLGAAGGTIIIPSTVKTIGAMAFSGCTSITTMLIPNGVTLIGANLFENSSIQTVTMPARNAFSYQSIFSGFAANQALGLTLTATGETALPTGAFKDFNGTNGKPRLTSIVLPNDLISIGGSAFENCSAITAINIPASVTTLGASCFMGCSILNGIDLSGTGVTVIPDFTFRNCAALGLVALRSNTAAIGESAFENCINIYTSTSGRFILQNSVATVSEKAFAGCIGLIEINFGTGLTSIASNTLLGSNNIEKVTTPLLSSVSSYETLFFGIGGTTKNFEVVFTVGNTTSLVNNAFNGFNGTSSKPKLTSITLPNNLTVIWNNAFQNCNALGSIVIPSTVETLGVYCFSGCTTLASIDLSVTQITAIPEGAFMGCASLKNVTLKSTTGTTASIGVASFKNSGLESIYNLNNGSLVSIGAEAFYNSKISSLDLSNTALTTIGNSTFALCALLLDVTLPNTLITIGEQAFFNCILLGSNSSRGSINIIGSNNTLPNNVTSIGISAFESCRSLIGVLLTNTGIDNLPNRAFMNCDNLEWIYLPLVIKTIEVSTFENDGKLSFVSSTTSLEHIGSQAFKGCSSLPSLTMYNIVSIQPDALVDCDDLTNITMRYISGLDYCALFTRTGTPGELNIIFENSPADFMLDTEIFKGFNGTNGLPKLVSIILPTNLTHIGDRAFEDCHFLNSIIIPDTVISIGLATFRNCTSLSELNLTTTGVTEIKNDTFSGCTDFSAIYFNSNTTRIGERAFFDCTSLVSINFTGMDDLTAIDDSAFRRSGLASVDLRPTSVTTIAENAFREAALTTVWLNTETTTIGIHAFSANPGLSTINITAATSLHTISSYAFYGCVALRSLVLPSSMSAIGDFAFANTSLGLAGAAVTLNNGLTTIGNSAFANTSLTSLTIPTSLTNIGENIFEGCVTISTVTMPLGNFNYGAAFTGITQNITIILSQTSVTALPDNAFQNFNGVANNKPVLISISLPSNLLTIGNYAFQNCSSLPNIPMPSGLTSIGNYAFNGCTGFTAITNILSLSALNSIGDYAFAGCTNNGFNSIDLTGTNVTTINQYAFSGCTNLVSVTLRSNTSKISAYAFFSCSNLTTINLASLSSLNTIEAGAFRNTRLGSINLTATGVTQISNEAFMNAGLTSITLHTSTLSIGTNAFSNNSFSSISLPYILATIGGSAFSGCTALATITIPTSVTSMGSNVFSGCSSLASIVMPLRSNFSYSSILGGITRSLSVDLTFVSGQTGLQNSAFSGLANVTSIAVPSQLATIGTSAFAGTGVSTINLSGTSVTLISANAFEGCTSLTSISLNTSTTAINAASFKNTGLASFDFTALTALTVIADELFMDSSNFSSATLRSGITSIGKSAFANTALTSISIPNSVMTFGAEIFSGCNALTSITMPLYSTGVAYSSALSGITSSGVSLTLNFVSLNTSIPASAFSGFNGTTNATRFTNVSIPAGVTAIGNLAFNNCSRLSNISLSGIITIGNSAFAGCSGLTAVTLPVSVTTIGDNAFANCANSSFTSVTIPATVATVGTYAFTGCNQLTVIKVPNAVLNNYRTAWWPSAASKIMPYDPVISFNSDGGNTVTSITDKPYGTILQSSDKPVDPVKTGYTFIEWCIGSSAGTPVSWTTYTLTDNVTLFAKWSINQYTITFNSNGGSTIAAKTQNFGTTVTKPADPVMTGYTFSGWYKDNGTFAVPVTWNYTITGSNETFYAKWTINQYTVSFNSNGGSVVAAKTQNFNTTVTQPGNPSRIGYTFDGWYSDSGLLNPVSWPYTMTANSVTFYAKWIENTLTITYNNNGAAGTMLNSTHNYTSVIGITNNFTNVGCTFSNWNTVSNGLGTTVTSGTTTVAALWDIASDAGAGNKTLTLYAIWTPNTYQITLNRNGGTGGPSGFDVKFGVAFYNTGTTTPIPTPITVPMLSGHTFEGYYYGATQLITSTGVLTGAFTTTYFNSSATLVAQWTLKTYSVSFNANGGSLGDGTVAPQTVGHGSTVSEPANAPVRTGWQFVGWYRSDDGGTTLYPSSYVFNTVIAETFVLYAKWSESIYQITLDNNGGTGTYNNIYIKYGVGFYLNAGATTALASLTGNLPTRTGYTFNGYYTVSVGGTQQISNTGVYAFTHTSYTAPATLYAQWTPIVYTITFDMQGGTPVQSSIYLKYGISFYLDAGATASPITSLTPPTKTGFTFLGYFSAVTGGIQYTTNSGMIIVSNNAFSASTQFIAQWAINQYTISFESNGGSAVSSLTTNYNTMITKPADPTKVGYIFAGWYKDAELSAAVTWTGTTYTVTINEIFYAKWTPCTITISYDSNEGSGGAMANTTVNYNTFSITISANTYTEPAGTTFAGWNTQANGAGQWIAAGAGTVAMSTLWSLGSGSPNKTLVLYAIWNVI